MQQQLLLFPEDQARDRLSHIFGTPEFKRRYRAYINSPRWNKLRDQVIERAEGSCERCGKIPKHIEVHHLTYERFENELLTDLQLLCDDPCHVEADGERKSFNAWLRSEKMEEARRESSRGTYCEKVYGEDWMKRAYYDDGRIDRRFERWYDRQRECGGSMN